MLAASGGSDRRIFELAAGMEARSVFDLAFTLDAQAVDSAHRLREV